jgi:GT2 family glycosyltransferase/glycosyltransferase involved in cell wall biosynthesis
MLRLLAIAARKALVARREGRLSRSPREWLRLLRQLAWELDEEAEAVSVALSAPAPAPSAADASTVPAIDGEAQRLALAAFLAGTERLTLTCASPRVSVVIVTYNRAELTLRCLKSLQAATVPIELVVVDNASTDATPRLLARLDGASVLQNAANEGFLRAANAGARRARADALLFLNNDTIVEAGSLEAAMATLESTDTIGAVVGRLVHLDGRLQEAGSMIWRDGTCQAYGRGDDPWAPPYMFRRNVDYGSGAFLLTRRGLFLQLGGFDERYAPAYYEDADYCVRLWQQGARVVYEPAALVRHVEFGSSDPEDAVAAQAQRRAVFAGHQREWLQNYTRSRGASLLRARSRWTGGQRLLFIEDRVPHERLGSGYPRTQALLRAALDLGHEVTLYPLLVPHESWDEAYADVPRDVEILLGGGAAGLPPHLQQHAADYDTILVSRPHNMRVFRSAMAGVLERPAIIYDAEAIFAMRDLQRATLAGRAADVERARALIAQEIALARQCDAVLTVTERERQQFVEHGSRNVVVVGHALDAVPTARPFADRRGFLFVGAFVDRHSPNTDAVRWFIADVLPRLRDSLADDATLVLVGRNVQHAIDGLADLAGVEAKGMVDDLPPLFDRARVFVAPTRIGAGMSIKVLLAAAAGIPIVTTSLIADQLGWRDGRDLLVADDPASFADRCATLYRDAALWHAIRESALTRAATACAPSRLRSQLERALALAQSSRFGDAVTMSVEPGHESGSN